MRVLTCREIEERLPWFLHGSLHPAERTELAAHLAGCAGCRGALAATREASELFAGHPEAATLVDYALGLPLDPSAGLERSTLELHLAHCAECREELQLVEADRSS
ncbi:MAG: Zf-HC2 protein, partial [Acidobacteriota bacterium]|nr:Zf-HC2 protein [Acidobacteriota bacterium]